MVMREDMERYMAFEDSVREILQEVLGNDMESCEDCVERIVRLAQEYMEECDI